MLMVTITVLTVTITDVNGYYQKMLMVTITVVNTYYQVLLAVTIISYVTL